MQASWFLMGVAVKTSAVLALAWLAAWCLRKRSAALRHLVWTAAAASVLALPLLSLILPGVRMPAGGALLALVPNITFQAGATAGAAPAAQAGRDLPRPMPAPARSPIDWRWLPALIWAAGTAVGLAQLAAAARAIARARRVAPPHLAQAESAALAKTLRIECEVGVWEAPAGTMPVACGFLRPAIFLPADASEWDAEHRRMVLLHELAHVRRGDAAAHLLARLALTLHWWNPLARLAWREALKERERSADDLVLLAGERASAYAGHLLDAARALQSSCPMARAALAMARRSQLEGRLLAILDPRVPRHAVARVSALATILLAVVTVAPVAAIRAQDRMAPKPAGTPALQAGSGAQDTAAAQPAAAEDVEAAIRAATDYETLDRAARSYARQGEFGTAQRLLEAALPLREKSAGRQSAVYVEGLVKLGDLSHAQKRDKDAADYYQQAVAAVNGKPEAARPLTSLGALSLSRTDYAQARVYFEQARAADPAHAGMPLTWIALTYEKEGNAGAQAETAFQQAMAAEDPASGDAATTLELYAMFLQGQGRGVDSDAAREKAAAIRGRLNAPANNAKAPSPSNGVYKVGNGVTPPALILKMEPEYTEMARLAKYEGKAVLYVEIGTDGAPRNIRVVRSLGLGLDEQAVEAVSQWKFKPGTRDGVPVTVAATIEVNFRAL